MIAYNLVCKDGHEFEGWFANSTAYDSQEKAGDLVCPVCGDARIAKAIMAPAVKNSVTKAKGRDAVAALDEQQKLRKFVAGFRKYVEENADYVGPKFPEEARKIHYGEAEERGLIGKATAEEAVALLEEGIAVAPLPILPDEVN